MFINGKQPANIHQSPLVVLVKSLLHVTFFFLTDLCPGYLRVNCLSRTSHTDDCCGFKDELGCHPSPESLLVMWDTSGAWKNSFLCTAWPGDSRGPLRIPEIGSHTRFFSSGPLT